MNGPRISDFNLCSSVLMLPGRRPCAEMFFVHVVQTVPYVQYLVATTTLDVVCMAQCMLH